MLNLSAEGARVARSQPITSIVVALIGAGVVLATMATTGRTVSAERGVLDRIDDAGTRVVQVIDDRPEPVLAASALQVLGAINTVDWGVGLGSVEDIRLTGLPGAEPTPARAVIGSSPFLVLCAAADGVGALVGRGSQARLGLAAAAGAVLTADGREHPIIGTFEATGPLVDLENSILLVGQEPMALRRVILQADTSADVASVVKVATGLLGEAEPGQVSVVVSDDLIRAQSVIRGELGGFGRAIVVQALGAGLVLMALAVLAGVNGRRRDFGRRRALGATRAQLVGVVVAQTACAALPGAVIGAVAGSSVVLVLADSWPGWAFPTAVSTLTVLAAAISAVAPAVVAAWRDPVLALRVP